MPPFADVGTLSITELCIAFMVMRDGNGAADDMAEQLECWFGFCRYTGTMSRPRSRG